MLIPQALVLNPLLVSLCISHLVFTAAHIACFALECPSLVFPATNIMVWPTCCPLKFNMLVTKVTFSPPLPLIPPFSKTPRLTISEPTGNSSPLPAYPYPSIYPAIPSFAQHLLSKHHCVSDCHRLWDIHHACSSSLCETSRTNPGPGIMRSLFQTK